MPPRRPPGASWAPGGPQVATKAVLRPPLGGSWVALGGSWGRLGALLAPPGAVLGLPGRSWAPFGPPGGLFGELFGSLFGALLENSRNLKKTMFFQWFLRFFHLPGGPTSTPNRFQIGPKSLKGAAGAPRNTQEQQTATKKKPRAPQRRPKSAPKMRKVDLVTTARG